MNWQLNAEERRRWIRGAFLDWLRDPEHMGSMSERAFDAAARVAPSWHTCDDEDSEAAADAIHALVADEKRRLMEFLKT